MDVRALCRKDESLYIFNIIKLLKKVISFLHIIGIRITRLNLHEL